MLLDTWLLQQLKLVMDAIGWNDGLTDPAVEELLGYPSPLGDELVALGEVVTLLQRDGPPWIVAEASLIEFERHQGRKGEVLRRWWYELANYFRECVDAGWYSDLDPGRLLIRRGSLVTDGQQMLPIETPRWPMSADCSPPLGRLLDAGDRILIRTTLRAGISTILTTDLESL